jgi:hypothetical protein
MRFKRGSVETRFWRYLSKCGSNAVHDPPKSEPRQTRENEHSAKTGFCIKAVNRMLAGQIWKQMVVKGLGVGQGQVYQQKAK